MMLCQSPPTCGCTGLLQQNQELREGQKNTDLLEENGVTGTEVPKGRGKTKKSSNLFPIHGQTRVSPAPPLPPATPHKKKEAVRQQMELEFWRQRRICKYWRLSLMKGEKSHRWGRVLQLHSRDDSFLLSLSSLWD